MKILDAGCGIGRWTNKLIKSFPEYEIHALDHKKRLPEIDEVIFTKGSVENLPYEDNTFDIIIASRLLPYVDLKKTIKELERVCKEDGIIVYELMRIGYYLRKLLTHPKRILNFINLFFYFQFGCRLFTRYDNIDSPILIKYNSLYNLSQKENIKGNKLPVYSIMIMTRDGSIYKKRLHNKIIRLAKKIVNEET
jgi:SAM-dependent methyltransferase